MENRSMPSSSMSARAASTIRSRERGSSRRRARVCVLNVLRCRVPALHRRV